MSLNIASNPGHQVIVLASSARLIFRVWVMDIVFLNEVQRYYLLHSVTQLMRVLDITAVTKFCYFKLCFCFYFISLFNGSDGTDGIHSSSGIY